VRPAHELAFDRCVSARTFSRRAQCKKGTVCLSTGQEDKKGSVSFRLFAQAAYLSVTRQGLHPEHLLYVMHPAGILRI
jgi:hypothetical protein